MSLEYGAGDCKLENINAVGLLGLEDSVLYNKNQLCQWERCFVEFLLRNAGKS